jgi:hypothetical protein
MVIIYSLVNCQLDIRMVKIIMELAAQGYLLIFFFLAVVPDSPSILPIGTAHHG